MYFVHDQLALGKKLRILTIAAPPPFPLLSGDGCVVQTLERICTTVGYPKTIWADNGSEFISRDLDLWAYAKQVTLDFSRPGKPTDNGFIEAFNSKLRSECLNAHWFMSLADAAESWRIGADTTTTIDCTALSTTTSRACCTFPTAPPARRRDQGRKLRLQMVQSW